MKTKVNGQTREEWLTKAIKNLTSGLFKQHGYKVPNVKISVGLPYGRGAKKIIGQHWTPEASIDNRGSIFISPTLDNSIDVLAVLVHELVHAAVGNKEGHGKVFKKCAVAVGLTGKMRATVAGDALKVKLASLVKKIGAYPHARLKLDMNPIKKQTTRLIKMECGDCGYIVRSSQKNIDIRGPVICPCNAEPMNIN